MWLYRIAVILFSVALFSGCGFQPLYSSRLAGSVLTDLSSIEVGALDGIIGVQLHNTLHDNLQLNDKHEKAYSLILRYDTTNYPMITAEDSQISRYTMILNVHYTLSEFASGSLLTEGHTSAHASYNVISDNAYATFVAEEEASLRAAKQIGNQIANLLSLHFSQRSKQVRSTR
ncbi:MAG: LPS assembly lipoprotein LptE [Pseudomonadota bacterium]|nr:LPS assembly lipoprotein LptE [Pseudomonadota bacterium]